MPGAMMGALITTMNIANYNINLLLVLAFDVYVSMLFKCILLHFKMKKQYIIVVKRSYHISKPDLTLQIAGSKQGS